MSYLTTDPPACSVDPASAALIAKAALAPLKTYNVLGGEATFQFDLTPYSGFNDFALDLTNLVPQNSANGEIWIRVMVQGAGNYANDAHYSGAWTFVNSTPSVGAGSGSTGWVAFMVANGQPAGANQAWGFSGTFRIYGVTESGNYKHALWDLTAFNGGVARYFGGGTYTNSTLPIVGLQFMSNGGTWAAGNVRLRGIQ